MILTEHLLNVTNGLRPPQGDKKSPCNWGKAKKKRERNQDRTCGPGRSCERGKVSLLAGRSAGTEGSFGALEENMVAGILKAAEVLHGGQC